MIALHTRKQVLGQASVVQIGVNHDAAVSFAGKTLEVLEIDFSGAHSKDVDNSMTSSEAFSKLFVVRSR